MRWTRAMRAVVAGIYFCPPQPGFTARSEMYSSSSRSGSSASSGVPGFSATPRTMPRSGSLALVSVPSFCSTRCDVRAGLDVNGDDVRADGDVFRHLLQRLIDHQVDVFEQGSLDGLDERRPDRHHGAKQPSITSTCASFAPVPSRSEISEPSDSKLAVTTPMLTVARRREAFRDLWIWA